MGRVGRLNIIVLILMIIGVGLVSGSSQFYNLNIDVEKIENLNSEEIILTVNSPNDGSIILSPIEFDLSLNYSDMSQVDCKLYIDGLSYDFGANGDSFYNIELSSGQKNWEITCRDFEDSNINTSVDGNFNVFDFSINSLDEFYFNDSTISGTVNSQGDFELKLKCGSDVQTINTSGGNFNVESPAISAPGKYELIATTNYYSEELSVSRNFSVGYASVKFVEENSNVEENVGVKLYIDSQGFSGNYYIRVGSELIAGDGFTGATVINIDAGNFKSSSDGSYSLALTGQVNNKNYNFAGLNTLTVAKAGNSDIDSPDIDLKYPAWEETVTGSEIEFVYTVEDDYNISECKLKIYNASKNSAGIYETDGLIFPLSNSDKTLANEDSLDKSDEVKLKLIDFDAGDFIWEVKCKDGSGNTEWDFNYFKVDFSSTSYAKKITDATNNYTREDEVNDLIGKINTFLEAESNLGIEERNALEILGIDGDMSFYKKQLIQMDQDLKFNLKFMEEAKREKRILEIDEEIDEIRDSIVVKIEVTDSYEYSKNSIDVDVFEIISRYFVATNHNIKSSALKGISRYNEGLQSKLGSRVEALRLTIDYVDESREMILVSKKLTFDAEGEEKLLEIIDEDITKEIIFVNDAKDIGEGIWEIEIDNLMDGELVYYFYDDLSLQKIEKTESLLFDEEGRLETNMITGFVVGISDGLSFSFYSFLIGFLFMGYVGFFLFGKARLEVWKKDVAVSNLLNLIEKTKLLLRQNDVENARENYHKMGEAYKLLPNKCKLFFFNEIKMVRLAIDKKDVLNLVKEYEKAKVENRNEDTIRLHARISEIYKKLPKKFQDKVYQRLVKNEIR